MDLLTGLTILIISLCTDISKHHAVHLKYAQFLQDWEEGRGKGQGQGKGYLSSQKTGSWNTVS